MRNLSRRQFLSAGSGALASATMAGCSGGRASMQPASTAAENDAADDTPASEVPSDVSAYSPREDDASGFVLLADVVPDIFQEIRYYTTYNFVGERIDGYEQPIALITRAAAEALQVASNIVMAQGYRLKVFDAYRPQAAVDHFVRWSHDVSDTRMKEYFYPDLDKSTIFELGYVATRSGHSRGSTVDLTLFDMRAGRDLDMGGTFDFFGEVSHPDNTAISQSQYANRMILRGAMTDAGFEPQPHEWWHFTLANEPYPDTYFTFPSSVDSLV